MSIVIVDWLGRGGIAQTSAAWAVELAARVREVTVVTRSGRFGRDAAYRLVEAPTAKVHLLGHQRLARTAARLITEARPSVVIVQNYVVPPLEFVVYRAARRVGTKIVLVVHDHDLRSVAAGSNAGLGRLVASADDVVVHSEFVRERLIGATRREPLLLPLPVQVAMLKPPQAQVPEILRRAGLIALHFGVVRRGYKGFDTVAAIARQPLGSWQVAVIGNGAPDMLPGAVTVPGFMPDALLVASVRRSAASLLPYTKATQSGSVALAQVLGSVPVVSAVGGLPEQVRDGITGVLVPPGSGVERWRDALRGLEDAGWRAEMAANARDQRWRDHQRFKEAADALMPSEPKTRRAMPAQQAPRPVDTWRG